MAEGFLHARQQAVLGIGARGVAHHALGVGELLVQQQGIEPLELGAGGGHEKSPKKKVLDQ